MARINKFASVNLNDLFGKKEPAVKTAVNASGSGARPKGASHGMLVLTRPVKQPIKIGAGSTVNLKKETSESLKPTATDTSGWPNTSQIESANGGLVKDNLKPAYTTDKPDAYVPPSLRGLHSSSVSSVSGKLEPVSVEKTAVLSGEEFPSLQASLAPANTNGQQQQTKDNQLDSKEQLEKLQHLSLQAQSKSCLNDVTEPDLNCFQPQRPQFFRPSRLRGNEQAPLEKPETVTERPDGYLSRNPHLISDDERANSFGNRPGSANGIKRPGSGGYSRQNYQSDGLSKENPSHGVNEREGQAEMEILGDNKSMFSPPSKGGRYEREEFPQPGFGGGRYHEREAFPRPGSGGSRYERETLSRPQSGGSRYEREALPGPGSDGSRFNQEALPLPVSGGSRYEREALPHPGSGGSRYGREVFPRPGSGGSRYEREALPQPGSDGSRFNQEALPRQVLGGSRYGREGSARPGSGGSRYEREGLARPGSGGSRYEREGSARPGSGGSRYEREALLQSGLDGSRFNQEVSPRPISGGSRNEREALTRPGSDGSRFNQEALPRPVSGGSRYEREVLPWPGSSGTSYERGAFPQPRSGGRRFELEVLPQPVSGGSRFERETLGHPNSSGGMREREALSSGYGGEIPGPCSSEYSYEREVISRTASGGGNYSRPGSAGSRYGREELILPESVGVYYNQPGFNGGSDYVLPNSGGKSYEREVVLRPGSGDNKNTRLSRPGVGGNSRIDGRELYRGSSFNDKQNYQRRETNSLMGYADGRNGNIHNAYESNRENGPFRRGGTSRELPNRNDYHGRGQPIVDNYGRDGAHDSVSTRQNPRHATSEGMFLEQLREQPGRFGAAAGAPRDDNGGQHRVSSNRVL